MFDAFIARAEGNGGKKFHLLQRTFRKRNPAQSTFDSIHRPTVQAYKDLGYDFAVAFGESETSATLNLFDLQLGQFGR